MDSRERDRIGHPPACTCVICNKKRLAGVSCDSRVKGCPVCDGLPKVRFHHGQYWDIYVDYDGRIRGPVSKVILAKHGRFRCMGCYGIVRKDEIDDPLLKSVEDEVHQYWERQGSTEEKKVCPLCGQSEYLSAVEKWSNTDRRFETTYTCSICDSGKRKQKAGHTPNQSAGVEMETGSDSNIMSKNKGLLDNLFDKIQKHLFGGDK